MKYTHKNYRDNIVSSPKISRHNLRANCENCFGLCCVALYFSSSDGFPVNKDAGQPCINLQSDFRCSVHKNLMKLRLKGCISYDCFGAGQKVAQFTFHGRDWRQIPESANQMYEVFLIMRQLHEMLWYLTEALTLKPTPAYLQNEIKSILNETERLTLLSPDLLKELHVEAHQASVNSLIIKISESVRSKFRSNQTIHSTHKKIIGRGLDFIGADLRKTDLRGENLRGAYLIAANLRGVDLSRTDLIGADLRDADIRGAKLTDSIFVTQSQINTTKGNSETKLPISILRPISWSK